jgi:hypothetical protein
VARLRVLRAKYESAQGRSLRTCELQPDHAVGLFVQAAHADEIRHTTFPNVMLGKTNILIEPARYRDGGGDCAVRWIVETAALCSCNERKSATSSPDVDAIEDK